MINGVDCPGRATQAKMGSLLKESRKLKKADVKNMDPSTNKKGSISSPTQSASSVPLDSRPSKTAISANTLIQVIE